jgi:hypothetical protein
VRRNNEAKFSKSDMVSPCKTNYLIVFLCEAKPHASAKCSSLFVLRLLANFAVRGTTFQCYLFRGCDSATAQASSAASPGSEKQIGGQSGFAAFRPNARLVSAVGVFALLHRMLHTEDDDFIIRLIGQIIDEIGETPRHQLAHAFGRLRLVKSHRARSPLIPPRLSHGADRRARLGR